MTHAGFTEVILNPAASGGRGARLRPRVEAWLAKHRVPYSLVETRAPRQAGALARAAVAKGVERILVVGGDGTIHEVANGLLDPAIPWPPPPLAVVPVGTGNDFFRMVGASMGVDRALEVLFAGTVGLFDVGRARFGGGERYFVNLMGVGVDVEVLGRMESFKWLEGLPRYLAALVAALASYRPETIRVLLEDPPEEVQARILLAAVTVGPSVGGGFLLSPQASPRDGLLDLFFVPTLGAGKLVRYIPKVIRGTHQGLPELRMRTFARGRLARADGDPFFFELDGERMPQMVRELEIEVVPARLPVVLPVGKP